MKNILLFLLIFISFNCLAQTYQPLTGKIEAETYDAIHGVGTETSEDTGGGLDVGWMNDSSWVEYNVNVASAGYYSLKLRVANGFSDNASIQIKTSNGSILAQKTVPRTGGMQGWADLTLLASLPAGNQTLRLYAEHGTFALNWFEATAAAVTLPGKIEAENFDLSSNVRNESTQDANGGMNVADIDDNDWLEYNVNVPNSGSYTFFFRVANSWGNGVIEIKDGEGPALGQVSIPRTGGWQNFVTVSTTANLSAGNHNIRLFAQQGAFNLNWFEVANETPLLTKTLPGRIEAEDFDGASVIQTENTGDTSGNLNVGSIEDGDWMDYHINVQTAGLYTFQFRVASPNGNGKIELKNASGDVLGQIDVPWTGGWQSYNTLSTTLI